jgi:rhodanese-related sulfurtransferase
MKKVNFYLLSLVVAALFFFTSCGGGTTTSEETKQALVEEVQAVNEAQILVDYLEANGNFINSKKVPTMIKSKEVHANLDNPTYLVVDIRKAKDFNKGHIKGAENIKAKDMITYFENDINPAEYEKIAIVCYSGQSASFTTSIMRLLGYDNVYAMKWGMSSWAMPFGEKWMSKVSNDFADQIEEAANPMGAKSELPTLNTGLTDAKAILKQRAQDLLAVSFKSMMVKAPELFNNGSEYYINNYWPEEKYNAGHVPGAIRYQPKKSLDTKLDLLTLPTDKKVVTYCFTGQHSAFVTAYLRILGYDAYSLGFGANSFMNGLMQERGEGWHAWSKKQVHDYEVIVEEVEEAIVDDGEEEGGCS